MTEIIPAINCVDFGCVVRQWEIIRMLRSAWVHVDVVDGQFAPVETWNDPDAFSNILGGPSGERPKIEVHLMVENPTAHIGGWLRAGIKRCIFHVEALDKMEESEKSILWQTCVGAGCEVGLAVRPETSVDDASKYFSRANFFQLLSVTPGFSGQTFQADSLSKIYTIKERVPHAVIEVDGGVTPEVIRLAKPAGASIFASASYILGSPNPSAAYEELKNI